MLETIERRIEYVYGNVSDNEHAANQLTLAIHLHDIVCEQNLLVPYTAAALE